MKVALVDVDGKIENLALMKISAWRKKKGDAVEPFDPLFSKPDIIYASKIFTDSPDFEYYPEGVPVVCGGSGYDLSTELPPQVESMMPDYDLYHSKCALGFTTRGCRRNCLWCIVPAKEGQLRPVADLYDIWQPGLPAVCLLDNNILGLPDHFELVAKQIIKERLYGDFNQGLDIRLLRRRSQAELLAKIRRKKNQRIHFAFDTMAAERAVVRGVKLLNAAGIKSYALTFFVLIGFDTDHECDLYRVELLRSLRVNPFVMPFDRTDPYQAHFARWVNHAAIFNSVSWPEYCRRKGIDGLAAARPEGRRGSRNYAHLPAALCEHQNLEMFEN